MKREGNSSKNNTLDNKKAKTGTHTTRGRKKKL